MDCETCGQLETASSSTAKFLIWRTARVVVLGAGYLTVDVINLQDADAETPVVPLNTSAKLGSHAVTASPGGIIGVAARTRTTRCRQALFCEAIVHMIEAHQKMTEKREILDGQSEFWPKREDIYILGQRLQVAGRRRGRRLGVHRRSAIVTGSARLYSNVFIEIISSSSAVAMQPLPPTLETAIPVGPETIAREDVKFTLSLHGTTNSANRQN